MPHYFVIGNIISFILLYAIYTLETYNSKDSNFLIFLNNAIYFSILTGVTDYYLSKKFDTNIPLTLFMLYGIAELSVLIFIKYWESLDKNDDSDDYEENADNDIDL